MMKEVIICNAKNKTVTSEWIEDNAPQLADCQGEIEACKQRLAKTDYVVIKIAEGVASKEEYARILSERQAIRKRIGELENLQNA